MDTKPSYLPLDQVTQKMRDAVARGDALDMMTEFISLTPAVFGHHKRYKAIKPPEHNWRNGPAGKVGGWGT